MKACASRAAEPKREGLERGNVQPILAPGGVSSWIIPVPWPATFEWTSKRIAVKIREEIFIRAYPMNEVPLNGVLTHS